jgi:hypothetical protein
LIRFQQKLEQERTSTYVTIIKSEKVTKWKQKRLADFFGIVVEDPFEDSPFFQWPKFSNDFQSKFFFFFGSKQYGSKSN